MKELFIPYTEALELKQYESGSTNKRLLMELPNYIYEQLK